MRYILGVASIAYLYFGDICKFDNLYKQVWHYKGKNLNQICIRKKKQLLLKIVVRYATCLLNF